MKSLADLRLFVRAAKSASLSEAARALDTSPAAASATIKRLEAELGAPLFARSTRSLRLTPEGEQFLARCEPALDAIESAAEDMAHGRQMLRGTVQLSMPSDLGRNLVLDWLAEFGQRHPNVRLRVQLADRLAGLYREPVDIALRYGATPDSGMVSLAIAPDNRRVLCAAPIYVARHGMPASPAELTKHNCLCFMLAERMHDRWQFRRGRETVNVDVRGSFQSDDGDAVRRLAVAGEGIAYKSALDVASDLRAGRLVPLCTDWEGESAPLHMMCADRRLLRPLVRKLREFIAERCARAMSQP
jgi:DNA-binding transcriptional LysR family regulator